MSFIKWSEDYSVGIEKIDMQHKKLVSYINELHDAMKDGQSNSVIGDILNKLVKYTKEHFSTEEEYMQKYNYKKYSVIYN